jgi:Uma2 family endonuclease
MSVTHQISIEDYLAKAYRPDRDYVDGEVEQRNVGEKEHSIVQAFFVKWFAMFERDWQLEAFPEIRIRVTRNRVRIADIAVERIGIPYEAVLEKPPIAVVEILSPQDRVSRYQERLEDYRSMGIEHVWVIDPIRCKAYDCSAIDWQPVDNFTIAGTPVHVALVSLWEKLAKMHSFR